MTPTAGRSGQSELRTVSVVFSDRYLLLLLILPRIFEFVVLLWNSLFRTLKFLI